MSSSVLAAVGATVGASGGELLCSVSASGDTVALCSADGVVKFYDTLSSSLKCEYASSAHLHAGCTSLAFAKHRKRSPAAATSSKQKKLKPNTAESIENDLNDLDLIAMGTSQGAVLLFSLAKAALHTQLSGDGHVDKVNDICWCGQAADALYSCADDGHVVEWSIVEAKARTKWRASKTAVTAVAVDATSKFLISASKTITVWDLESKVKLKTLTGHSNDIFRMTFLSGLGDADSSAKPTSFFLSAAVNDRILNAWSLESTSSSLLSLTINDGPTFVDVVATSEPLVRKEREASASSPPFALVCAVTGKGQLFVYSQALTAAATVEGGAAKIRKPAKALNQLQIETKEGIPLKIFGAFVANASNERLDAYESASELAVFVVYGSHVNPTIEKLKLCDFKEQKVVLKREDPFRTSVTLQTEAVKIETPTISKELKVLQPGFMAPQTHNITATANPKRKSTEPSQMSLEERLNVMGIESNSSMNGDAEDSGAKQGQMAPKTDNLLVLLVQGLQSNDAKMLNHVLQHKNEKVVVKTVRMLPTNHIIPLVKELNKRLQGHAQSGMGIVKWLKYVLMTHTSYLMSYPDLIDSLGSVYEMMNARTKLFPQLSKLQGKLQLVMSQVSSQAESLQSNEKDGEPLLFYQDSNSEDEQFEELIPSHSEYDDYLFSEEEEEDEEMDNDDEDGQKP